MSSLTPPTSVVELPGVRRCWTGTAGGGLAGAEVIDPAAALGRELALTGELLGIGSPSCASCRGETTTWVVATRGEQVLAIEVDPARPLGAVEAGVVALAWPPLPAPFADDDHETSVVELPRIAEGSRPVQASVFSGTLQTFALPDLLEFLRNGQKTGTLVCTSAGERGEVRLRGGKIIDASAPATPPLVRDGRATAAQLQGAMSARIYEAVGELLGWTEGEFSFAPAAPFELGAIVVELDAQTVLLEIFTRLDESAANL